MRKLFLISILLIPTVSYAQYTTTDHLTAFADFDGRSPDGTVLPLLQRVSCIIDQQDTVLGTETVNADDISSILSCTLPQFSEGNHSLIVRASNEAGYADSIPLAFSISLQTNPGCGVSPTGTRGLQITVANCDFWTINPSNGQISKNGIPVEGVAYEIAYVSGNIYVRNGTNWYLWKNPGWQDTADPFTVNGQPPPTSNIHINMTITIDGVIHTLSADVP